MVQLPKNVRFKEIKPGFFLGRNEEEEFMVDLTKPQFMISFRFTAWKNNEWSKWETLEETSIPLVISTKGERH